MEAQGVRRKSKKKEKARFKEPTGEIPDAPRVEEFRDLIGESSRKSSTENFESNSHGANITSPGVAGNVEAECVAPLSSVPVVVETTEDKNEVTEVNLSNGSTLQEPQLPEVNGKFTLEVEVSAPNISEDLEASVDPCEEALDFPTAPGETYSYIQEQSGLLYPALDALSLVYPESPTEKSYEKVLSAPEAVTWIPQVLTYEFGESQIEALYSNQLLESSDSKVEEFLNTTKTAYDGFELYELLSNYLRASNQLCSCERTLADLREKCTDYEKQLWTISSETLSQTAVCDDGNQVVASHHFHVSNFDKQIYGQIDRNLKEIKELVKDSFSLYTYSVQLCKTQIKHFFHKSFKDINLQSFEVQGYSNNYPSSDIQNCASLLRTCLSTLFIFIRRTLCPQAFLKDCQQWVADCVGLLLRIATLDDHIFIINHVVRCPAGLIGKKLAQCVQIPKIPIPTSPSEYLTSGSNHLYLDFALCTLRTILRPVPKRDEYLKFATVHVSMQGASGDTNQWVVVDSDGEDDPDDVAFFKENDLINLFNQIPFANIFRRILLATSNERGDTYDVSVSNERTVLKLLAISGQMVSILGQGFVSYYTDRYRQLVKILGRMILHCVQYATDHIEAYWEQADGADNILRNPESFICREYDLFFRNAVGVLFSGKNIGTLQFLAAVPYHLISSEMLWHIYCAITKWNASETCSSLACPDISSEFENELVSMNDSDAFYLLTTLSNMAIARESLDANFVRVVTLHLFQIGFVSPLTRDSCSKTARDLLGNLTGKYPQIISVLLHTINTKMQILDKLSLYLLKELAFDFWKPSDLDMKLLSHWLVSYPSLSIEHQTARLVIQSMNWDFDENGDLFLPFDFHYQVALMIMESNLKWDKTQSLLAEGMKQMSALTNRSGSDTWAWDTIKRLHLHGFDRSSLGQIALGGILRKLPSFESHSELECVRKGVELKNPLGCLLSLYLTPTGHSVPIVCSRGFELVEVLLQCYRVELVIHSLFFITPLFVVNLDALHSQEKFKSIITTLLAVDMTYMRLAKNLITSDFPGEVTRLFGEMILTQLNQSIRFGVSDKSILRLWVEVLTSLDGWNKDNNILYLLDLLAKYSLAKEDCRSYFESFFYKMYKDMPSQSQSGIISLFSWTTPITTLLPNPSFSVVPYLLYYLLSIEMNLENSTGFWKSLCAGLNNPRTSLETAVKKASTTSKFATTSNYLTIYRWAQLGIELQSDHELSFLVWQKFFLRYLHRVSENQTTYSCVAGRFFDGIINSAFLRKVKKKIEELGGVCREKFKCYESSPAHENASENPMLMMKLLNDRIMLSSAFALWIEDEQLLLPSLYLPALPPQYMPSLLLTLIDGEEITWDNFVDFEAVAAECTVSARTFMCTICRNCWFERCRIRRFSSLGISLSNKSEDILKRLKSYDDIMHPPSVPLFEDVAPVPSADMFSNITSMRNGINVHFKELQKYSSTFSLQISQLLALNCGYWESLPDLYTNTKVEMLVNARCSGTKNWEGCTGPARVLFKYTEARLNETAGHQIHQNRIEYQQLMDSKSTQPPPLEVCIAAVFVEDFITNLVLENRAPSNQTNENRQRIQAVGEDLFYQATSLLNDQNDFYPPTRQLFSSLLEVLGNEFIASKPGQSRRLVSTCIRNPKLIGSLAPHLNLANCSPSVLIDIYKDVVNIPRRDIDLQFVILTKFDINSWLVSVKPKLNERSQLLTLIWKALTSDGLSPDDEKLMVYDTFRNHLKCMLLYDFPQHYGEILTFLLHGIDQRTVSLNLWYDFCNGLSRDFVRFSQGMDAFARRREVKRFATEGSILDHQELIETAQLLAHHFKKERMTHGLYGLYSKYREYIEPLSLFIQMISYSTVASSLKNARGMLSQKIIDSVWPIIKDMYAPWILPYNHKFIQQHCAQWVQLMNFDSNTVLQPWIGSDSNLAMIIVNDFTDCVMFLVETLPGTSAIFSYLWNFYVENFAQNGVKEHVLGVVHNCLVSVPWAMFWPTFSDVETMCKVVERFLPICHSFLSVVFAQVSWLEWIGSLGPKLNAKGHSMLLNLTVRLANDTVARESPTWIHVMERAETKINWLCIPSNSLEPILNWFVMSIDPRVILKLESNHPMDDFLLRLLKAASGYGFMDEVHRQSVIDLNNKRYIYVRSLIRLVLSAASKHKNLLDTNAPSFEEGIKDIISDVVDTIRNEGQPIETFLPHLREVVSLMSNHILMTVARNSIISWCLTNSRPPLNFLLALIQLSNSLKVHAYVIAPLLETVIDLSFQHPETTWGCICETTTFNPEEINNFFEVTSKDGHYLVLYTLLMKRYRNYVTGGEHSVMHLTDLVKFLKPKESNEEALPLLYGTILNIICEIQASAKSINKKEIDQPVKKFLRMLSQHLNLVGEDKQGWGLLTALGIGKASQLTIRGRLFAKCLGLFVLVQIPTGAGIRVDSQLEGHFSQGEENSASGVKPHAEVQPCLEKLEALKINRQYSDLIECVDCAINFIKDPSHTLSHTGQLISKLNSFLFEARYLM